MCRATACRTAVLASSRGPLATRATWYSAAAGLMSGSSPEADVVTRSTGIGASPFACAKRVDVGRDPVDERLARWGRGSSRPRRSRRSPVSVRRPPTAGPRSTSGR